MVSPINGNGGTTRTQQVQQTQNVGQVSNQNTTVSKPTLLQPELQSAAGKIDPNADAAAKCAGNPALAADVALQRAGNPAGINTVAADEVKFKATDRWQQAPSMDAVRSGSATLERGMMGGSVADLQRKLNAMGVTPPLAVDGKLGPLTEAALKSFQKAGGVPTSGKLDNPSLSSLETNLQKDVKDRPQLENYYTPEVARQSLAQISRNDTPFSEEEMKGASPAAQALAAAGRQSAAQMQSVGYCARGVANALQSLGLKFDRKASAADYKQVLDNSPQFVKVDVSQLRSPYNAQNLPVGAVSVYGRSPGHQHGHISIAQGNGMESSDHIQRHVNPARYGSHSVYMPAGTDLSQYMR